MNPIYETLYQEMLKDIERCMGLPHPEKENSESCFWIARNYWEKLKEEVKGRGFKNASEEICFFREVKPQFTFHIEYFVILTEALQFEPLVMPVPEDIRNHVPHDNWDAANQKFIAEYWEHEEKRFKRFCQKHAEFIEYYESGEHCKDSIYFLRESDTRRDAILTSLYDNDKDLSTYHSQLLRSYLSNKKYWNYVNEKIKVLTKRFNN